MPNTTIMGQILLCKVVNIGPGNMWILNCITSRQYVCEQKKNPAYKNQSPFTHIIQSETYVSKAFAYFSWNENSHNHSPVIGAVDKLLFILTQEIRNGHTTPEKSNIIYALQQPVWQESIVLQYHKNVTVKS